MLPYLLVVGARLRADRDRARPRHARWSPASRSRRCWSPAASRLRHLALVAAALGVRRRCSRSRSSPTGRSGSPASSTRRRTPRGAGFQGIQASIALGSGGMFGVGLGESVQKAFYLPEAHTDMIAAVIGEELGLVGITVLVGLFGLFGYAGFRTAQRAARPLRQAARDGAHRAGPGPGGRQPVRGHGPGPADRSPAPVRLVREQQPAGDARRGGADAEHRSRWPSAGARPDTSGAPGSQATQQAGLREAARSGCETPGARRRSDPSDGETEE